MKVIRPTCLTGVNFRAVAKNDQEKIGGWKIEKWGEIYFLVK
jgi:hypothetical protein